jgi:radical SAM superfamily enzyme with C-terminal helix-hairpin-helix motif
MAVGRYARVGIADSDTRAMKDAARTAFTACSRNLEAVNISARVGAAASPDELPSIDGSINLTMFGAPYETARASDGYDRHAG